MIQFHEEPEVDADRLLHDLFQDCLCFPELGLIDKEREIRLEKGLMIPIVGAGEVVIAIVKSSRKISLAERREKAGKSITGSQSWEPGVET